MTNDLGAAIVGATVDLLDRNTTTPVRATTTTDANGLWAISHATEGRFDVRITNSSSVRWYKWDTRLQLDALEVSQFRVRNPAYTFEYDIVPGAITADRQLNLPVITGTDTLATLGLAQSFSATQNHLNDVLETFGTGGDIALVERSTTLGANTALTSVLIGTPVTPALAADSFILSNTTASGDILIAGNLGGNSRAYLFADVSADTLDLMSAGVSRIRFDATGGVYIGDTSNGNVSQGLTIMQAGFDDQIFAVKSSDIAHGMTAIAETDTYGFMKKVGGTFGGLEIQALTATGGSNSTLYVVATNTDAVDTTHSAAGFGVIRLRSQLKSGTGATAVGANGNLFTVENNGATTFIMDAEGDLFADGSDVTVYDEFDDALMLRAFDLNRGKRGIVNSEWDRFVRYNERDLVDVGILGAPLSKKGLINYTLLARFQNGAIWQLHTRLQDALGRLAIAERKLAALPAGGN